MRVQVDPDKCQGHTLCAMKAASVFELSDYDGHATAVDGDISAGLTDDVLEAQRSCPEQAISVS